MISSLIATSAPGSIAGLLANGPWAATSTKAGFNLSDAVALFVIVVAVALIMVIVLGMRPRNSPGLRSSQSDKIKEAAARDVEAIEEDDKYYRSDAPGRQEDEL
ncbi:MAG TPA: hypothetical protein VLW50_03560 [Streptosporangiaceae bacterium]|nr:hypothetical protein [Streptosporangiaceae bacterium]